MTGNPLCIPAAALGLALVACASAAPSAREAAMSIADAGSTMKMLPVTEWPLRFESHSFGVHCYDTYACQVSYAGRLQRDDDPSELRPSSASYGADYQQNWSGTHGMIRNFPPPAEVEWRSKDGQPHQAKIDMGDIFSDGLLLHNVDRLAIADLPDGKYVDDPAVLLEVNDRTIRVYMRAHIPTRVLQNPKNLYSNFRNDLILARTYTF